MDARTFTSSPAYRYARIFLLPPFPLEETSPSSSLESPTGFVFFFGGGGGKGQVELRGSTMPRTFLRFFGGRSTRPVMHFSTGEKEREGGKGERQSGGQRERKERKKEGREGGKKRAKNRRILCSQPDLPPLSAPPLSLGEMKKRSVRSTGHSPNILEATTTAHPIRPLFSLFFPLFFRSFLFFFLPPLATLSFSLRSPFCARALPRIRLRESRVTWPARATSKLHPSKR